MKRLLLTIALLLTVLAPHADAQQAGLRVEVLDIGQGDSTLIVSPTGKIVLVDSGDRGDHRAAISAIRRHTGRQCRIDLFVVSHGHSDHMGSAVDVLNGCRVARILDSGFTHTTPTYEAYQRAVLARGADYNKATPGQEIDLGGGAKLTVLAPIQPYFRQSELRAGADPPNANSVVMRLDHGNFSMLFTGDAEAETEARLLTNGANVSAKVLKVGHHGARFASSPEFLRAVNAESATISVGATNRYGHPSPEALGRLRAARAQVYRTDLQGPITITSTGRSYRITFQRMASQEALYTGRRPPQRRRVR